MPEQSDSKKINEVAKVVEDFGLEWSRFDQSELSKEEFNSYFEEYFSIFPWSQLGKDAQGFDLGCGSGRWARFVSERVGKLVCIDASQNALSVAKKNLADLANVEFICASVSNIPLDDDSMDFGYSLGVLHHVPDTASGLANCVRKLKAGAPFLVYLYYAFDNRPLWFSVLWKMSDIFR
ncbi:MAG: class I SAM-dependent methyltransferase, partial [bacterium]